MKKVVYRLGLRRAILRILELRRAVLGGHPIQLPCGAILVRTALLHEASSHVRDVPEAGLEPFSIVSVCGSGSDSSHFINCPSNILRPLP